LEKYKLRRKANDMILLHWSIKIDGYVR